MANQKILSQVYESAEKIIVDDATRIIIFSDVHRGDNGYADDFAPNENIYLHALNYYYTQGFTYIELGDGDELWENDDFSVIREAHHEVFMLMKKFYDEGRFYLVWGNHDMERKSAKVVEKSLYYYEENGKKKPLFENIRLHRGLLLAIQDSPIQFFLTHGHQVDVMGHRLWRYSRFVVRRIWRHLQRLGFNDPTSPAKNYRKRAKVERKLAAWITARQQPLIVGHTHRPAFPDKGQLPYFNTGSCVHPRVITGIEIAEGNISLVNWALKPEPKTGYLKVHKDFLHKPEKISAYFSG
ncbi:MAG: hypothetical protein Kow0042_22860 [Calditrichia bacterium]